MLRARPQRLTAAVVPIGSRYQRLNGVNLPKSGPWSTLGPTNTFKGYSYRFSLPDYSPINGAGKIVLNGVKGDCTMVDNWFHFALLRQTGIMSFSEHQNVRMHVNGNFLRYMQQYEHGNSDSVDRYVDESNRRCKHQSAEVPGDLFKAQGYSGDECAYGFANWRRFNARCGYTEDERYEITYGRKTYRSSRDHKVLIDAIRKINSLNTQSESACSVLFVSVQFVCGFRSQLSSSTDGCPADARAWIIDNFDLKMMFAYIVVQSYAGEWDNLFHNQFMYRRESDGKWSWVPWDADSLWIANSRTTNSLYSGTSENDYHVMKNAVILCFKNEINQVYLEFMDTFLSIANMNTLLDDITSKWNRTEANTVRKSVDARAHTQPN